MLTESGDVMKGRGKLLLREAQRFGGPDALGDIGEDGHHFGRRGLEGVHLE